MSELIMSGWRKDPFKAEDYVHPTKPRGTLPDIIDNNRMLGRDKNGKLIILNQGNQGACTGHTFAEQLVSMLVSLGVSLWEAQQFVFFSPRWIYNGARMLEGTLPYDAGAYPRDCLDFLLEYGTLLETQWPYIDWPLDTSAPSPQRIAQAVKQKDFRYERCVDGVGGVLSALAAGHCVAIGTPWPDTKWNTPEVNATGMLPEVTVDDFKKREGHETLLFKGHQSINRMFGVNSWGKWGGKFDIPGAEYGLYSMPFSAFDVFKQLGGYDAHIIMFNAPDPAPVPTPQPGPTPTPVPEPPKPGCLLGNFKWLIGR